MPWKPAYITGPELGAYVRGTSTPDSALEGKAEAASRAVDRATGRQFGKTDAVEERFYRARWSATKGMWYVETDDFMTLDGFAVTYDSASDGTYVTPVDHLTQVVLNPINAAQEGEPWRGFYVRASAALSGVSRRPAAFGVSAVWGWTTVPETVREATLLQASRLAARRNAPFGVAGSPNDGSEVRLLSRVDPDVDVMLRDFKRKAWAR